jgi:uracil-DNA glycosylase family 4
VGKLIQRRIATCDPVRGKLMNTDMISNNEELHERFLNIVTQVRMHLEYQRALGVESIEILPVGTVCPVSATIPTKATSSFLPDPVTEMPLSPQGNALAAVCGELGGCVRCKLHKKRTNIVFGEGNPNAAIVFIGEGPGHEEDREGRPFVGAAGQLLTDIIVKGMKLKREDVYICNIVKCRPPDNRNPEPDEISACVPFLAKQLQAIKPKVIVALGNTAAKTLLKTDKGITALRGVWQSYQGIPLMPTFHPAYLLRNPKDKALVWKDIQQVMAEMGKVEKG